MFSRRRLLLVLGALMLAALSAGAWYVCTKGFTRRWRSLIAGAFEKRGVELSLQRLTLDPFRGLVAQNVKLYDAHNHRRVLAVINEVLLGVNYAEAFRGGNFLDWVDLRDATVTLPLSSDKGPQLEASRLNARLFFAPKQLYLARAQAEILGVQVYATGRLLNPEEFPSRREANPVADERLMALFDLLSSLHYQGASPILSVEFSGDLAQPKELSIDARLHAESVRRKSYSLAMLNATATCRRGVLELQSFAAADGHGEIHGAGSYNLSTSKYSARFESTLALNDLMRAYGLTHRFEALQLYAPPNLDLTFQGSADRPKAWQVFGHVAVEKFAYQSVVFKGFAADIGWMHGHWSVRDMRLRHASGRVEGDLLRTPEGFRASLHGTINPRELSPEFTGPLTDWLNRFDFVDPPTFSIEVRGARPSFEACQAEGEIHFGRSTFEGAAQPEFTTRLRYAKNDLTLAPFRKSPDQAEDSQLNFNLRTKELRIEKIPVSTGP